MRDLTLYPFEVRPLTEEDGGYLISFPDFSECISDGETPEEAIRNGIDALTETIAALEDGDQEVIQLALRHVDEAQESSQDDDDLRSCAEE